MKERRFILNFKKKLDNSWSLSTYSPGQLEIFGHQSASLSVEGEQIGVLKHWSQVSLSCFLESEQSLRTEPDVFGVRTCDLFDYALEGPLSNEEVGGLLVLSDLLQHNSPETTTFFHQWLHFLVGCSANFARVEGHGWRLSAIHWSDIVSSNCDFLSSRHLQKVKFLIINSKLNSKLNEKGFWGFGVLGFCV